MSMIKIIPANLEGISKVFYENPRAVRNIIKMGIFPVYTLDFEFKKISDNNAIELIELFGSSNFFYLTNKINSFNKHRILQSKYEEIPASYYNKDKKIHEVFGKLENLTSKYNVSINESELYGKPVSEREGRDLEKEMFNDYLMSQENRLQYGRLHVPLVDHFEDGDFLKTDRPIKNLLEIDTINNDFQFI